MERRALPIGMILRRNWNATGEERSSAPMPGASRKRRQLLGGRALHKPVIGCSEELTCDTHVALSEHTSNNVALMEARNEVQEWLRSLAALSSNQAQKVSDAFHRTVTAVTSGAIGFSLVFAEKLAPPPVTGRYLLILSWCCFAISLVAVLSSFLMAVRGQSEVASRIAALTLATLRGTLPAPPSYDTAARSRALVLAWAAVMALSAGLTFLVLFTTINYP